MGDCQGRGVTDTAGFELPTTASRFVWNNCRHTSIAFCLEEKHPTTSATTSTNPIAAVVFILVIEARQQAFLCFLEVYCGGIAARSYRRRGDCGRTRV